jgi:hypothetical protein
MSPPRARPDRLVSCLGCGCLVLRRSPRAGLMDVEPGQRARVLGWVGWRAGLTQGFGGGFAVDAGRHHCPPAVPWTDYAGRAFREWLDREAERIYGPAGRARTAGRPG